jgi:hypothetical protein
MKLGTLLAAGKSIIKGQVGVSYRANSQVYLPKFGSVKNPFKPEAAQPVPETVQPAQATPQLTPGPTRVAGGTATAKAATALSSLKQKLPALSAMAEKKKTDWAGKFNPASIFHRTAVKSGAKPSDKAAQTELSLDSVKVVQNDLTDVDVEVVPMKSRSGATEPEAAKKSWNLLGEQLLRNGAS